MKIDERSLTFSLSLTHSLSLSLSLSYPFIQKTGRTALTVAIQFHNLDVGEVLLSKGAQASFVSEEGGERECV